MLTLLKVVTLNNHDALLFGIEKKRYWLIDRVLDIVNWTAANLDQADVTK